MSNIYTYETVAKPVVLTRLALGICWIWVFLAGFIVYGCLLSQHGYTGMSRIRLHPSESDQGRFNDSLSQSEQPPEHTPAHSLSQRILECFDALTKAEQRLANVLLEDSDALMLQSATALSSRAGVSKATTARFFQRLNYVNYRSAQKAVRQPGSQRNLPKGVSLIEDQTPQPSIGNHLDNDVQNLVRTIEQLKSEEFRAAVRHLARADKLWIVGFGDNYPLAHLARSLMIRVKADIRMIPIGGFSIPEEFASIQNTDGMIALGLGRKTRSLRSIMRSAISNGAHVVYVTDQVSRAGPDLASITLRCRTHGSGVFDSLVAPVSLLTHLCSSVALHIGASAIERLQVIEELHDDWGDLLPGEI